MKVAEKVGTVLTGGNIITTTFGFEMNRKAFEILSAGIYSDKVRAIVRELSTNAADAHSAAGKADVPFTVHLPNNLEPWFEVRDEGTGLSEDQIIGKLTPVKDEAGNPTGDYARTGGIYTTYFKSDKTDSNDFTGCLGLGSKSPFAYTDSFTVESRYNGTKSVYNAFLNEKGFPGITKMTEERTTEPNGLTVRLPVNSGDFYEFQNKAAETLQWFTTRPKVTGYHNFEYPEKTYLRKTEKYGVYKTHEWNARSFVVMGNVAYPIDTHDLFDYQESNLKNLVSWGCELYANIGDVDISASREKLGYNKQTIKFIKDALADALADLEKEVTKDIASKPTLWQARKALHEVRNSFKGFNFSAVWNGKSISDKVNIERREVLKDGTKTTKPTALLEVLKIKSYRGDGVVLKKDRGDSIYADDTPIFLNDERGAYAGVRRYLNDKGRNERVYLLSDYDQDWLDETGISEVAIKASSLPKPARQAGTRESSQKAKIYEFVSNGNSGNGGSEAAGYWKPAEVDPDDGGVYVEILYFNWRMQDGEATEHPSRLNRPLQLLETLGRGTTLYGIRPSDKAMLEKSEGNWQTLKAYASEVVKEEDAKYYPDLVKKAELNELTEGYYRKKVPFTCFAEFKFIPTSPFGKFIAAALDAKETLDHDAESYGLLRMWTGLNRLKDNEDTTRLYGLQEKLWDKYPMLQYISFQGDDVYKTTAEYVNLIDAQDAQQVAA